MPEAKTITRTMTITVNMPEAQVNVAKPRLIVAGRQVKRRFTAGLIATSRGLIAAGLLVNRVYSVDN